MEADRIGIEEASDCQNCGSRGGRKLDRERLEALAYTFFVLGTTQRFGYGAAPLVQFNQYQTTSIDHAPWLESDLRLFEGKLGIGFFYYGPRLWMLGEVEPLKALQRPSSRSEIVRRILTEYPALSFSSQWSFYRVRINPENPADPAEYDSPPPGIAGTGRLESTSLAVMYGSPDLQVCVHECRATAADEIFIATLYPSGALNLMDLTKIIHEEGVTEFESLDLAINMLFLAGPRSYEIARDIASAAQTFGYDGLLYPSYFSPLRTGGIPFETTYGISHRRFPNLFGYERAKIVPNVALFGRPIEEGKVSVKSINRVVMRRVEYDLSFGPVGLKPYLDSEELEQVEEHFRSAPVPGADEAHTRALDDSQEEKKG